MPRLADYVPLNRVGAIHRDSAARGRAHQDGLIVRAKVVQRGVTGRQLGAVRRTQEEELRVGFVDLNVAITMDHQDRSVDLLDTVDVRILKLEVRHPAEVNYNLVGGNDKLSDIKIDEHNLHKT